MAQTPQAFRRDVLAAALAQSGDATDEATLAERAGHRVQLVEGEATNIKITTAEDLPVAEGIAQKLRLADSGLRVGGSGVVDGISRGGNTQSDPASDPQSHSQSNPQTNSPSAIRHPQLSSRPARTGRAGTGYDLHRLVAGRPLVIGGVTIPADRGALGHSDADVVCHAVTDAILGAAGLGDIGSYFPDSDARWKDASSVDLLRHAVALVAAQGFEVGNVDITVVLERPKIKDYVTAMRATLAQALGVDVGRVSITGKTNEGVDAVGRGEAIAAHAIALIRAI
jgi:2-C-methyl-D-erythritol 2,4-cyclodiphosphate synthase